MFSYEICKERDKGMARLNSSKCVVTIEAGPFARVGIEDCYAVRVGENDVRIFSVNTIENLSPPEPPAAEVLWVGVDCTKGDNCITTCAYSSREILKGILGGAPYGVVPIYRDPGTHEAISAQVLWDEHRIAPRPTCGGAWRVAKLFGEQFYVLKEGVGWTPEAHNTSVHFTGPLAYPQALLAAWRNRGGK